MNTKTTTATNQEDFYNLLMEHIEPELCTYNLPVLEDLYAGETEAEKEERFAHYKQCMTLLWDLISELKDMTKQDLSTFQHMVMNDVKTKADAADEDLLSGLEETISQS